MSDCACVLPRAERGDLRTIRGRPERRWRPSTSSIGSASPWEACPEVGWQTAQMGPRGGDGPSHPAALAPRPSPAGPIRLRLSGHQGAPSSTAHLSRKGLLPLQPFGHPPSSGYIPLTIWIAGGKREMGKCWWGRRRLAGTGLGMSNATLPTHKAYPWPAEEPTHTLQMPGWDA